MRPSGALTQVGDSDDVETRIYRAVFDSVMSQRLTPGTKLTETSLCSLFGVSRSVVRKVLQRLAHDHIVQLRPNRGAIVAVPTPEETRQIFEARRALEAAIVQLVALHATAADLNALRQQLAQEHQAMHRYGQPDWARLASGFHMRLAALCRNPILERYLVETISRCSLIVALHEPPATQPASTMNTAASSTASNAVTRQARWRSWRGVCKAIGIAPAQVLEQLL